MSENVTSTVGDITILFRFFFSLQSSLTLQMFRGSLLTRKLRGIANASTEAAAIAETSRVSVVAFVKAQVIFMMILCARGN